ncbi:MAG: hypothetical protein CSYNP_01551 [Syntrophus sp. SKADARSKE-3]|nr:hypothetical protein [Syntrophus sp. SKADARSKE-3]
MITPISALITGDIKRLDKIQDRTVMPPLAVGEVVDATVMGKQNGKTLISVKGMTLEASSTNPLTEGQKITVRISQVSPKIIMVPLGIMDGAEGSLPLTEHIKAFKQDPAMLLSIFKAAKDVLSSQNVKSYQSLMPDSNVVQIKEHLESLLFSKDTLGNYADKLGLLHEHAIAAGNGTGDNLKAMLMKLQEDIQRTVAGNNGTAKDLAGLSEFAASTIGKIETYQAVNLMSMQKDGLFFLPIPFMFQQDIQTGEFFASTKETAQGKELRAVVFLETDKLGKVMAEARLTGDSIRCFFRCDMPDTRDLLAARTAALKDGLDALGYKTADIKCYHERNMDAVRQEILEEFPAYSESALNVMV